MSSLLLVVEESGGNLKKVSFNALQFGRDAAQQWGLDFQLLVIGTGLDAVATTLSQYGASKVHVVDAPAFENYTTEAYAQAVCQVAKAINASVIAGPATVEGKDLFPRVAGRLGCGMASDITGFDAEQTFKRPVWAGSVIEKMKVKTAQKVVTLRGSAFELAEPTGSSSEIVKVEVALTDAVQKVQFLGLESTQSARPDLAEASIVVSGGRGMKGAEGVQVVEALADALGAALGASRAVCDAGWVPNDLQVGQTGKVVAPDLYIACGISGAIQHLAGMKGSKTIVVINTDAEAPIFQVADYGLVADLFKAVPEMVTKIKAL